MIERVLVSPRPGVLRLDMRIEERAMAERKGLKWTDDENDKLKSLLYAGATVPTIALRLKRTPGGVLEQMRRTGLLTLCGVAATNHLFRYYNLTSETEAILRSAKHDYGARQWGLYEKSEDVKIEEKELDMLEVNLENKTFINGVDASTMSNDDLLKMARRLYVEGRDLQEMKQNKLVAARLEIVEKSLSNLLGYMDKRVEDKNV